MKGLIESFFYFIFDIKRVYNVAKKRLERQKDTKFVSLKFFVHFYIFNFIFQTIKSALKYYFDSQFYEKLTYSVICNYSDVYAIFRR